MRSAGFLARSKILATSGLIALTSMQTDARVVHIPEICMRVTVPNGRTVCSASSPTWHATHGISFDIDALRNCKAEGPKINRIGIWQDANSGDDSLKDYTEAECGKTSRAKSMKRNGLLVSGMPSFFCMRPDDRYGLRVNLVGYAGVWDGKPSQPAIFYKIWMVTQRDRLHHDMAVFEKFVRSARVEDSRCLAELTS